MKSSFTANCQNTGNRDFFASVAPLSAFITCENLDFASMLVVSFVFLFFCLCRRYRPQFWTFLPNFLSACRYMAETGTIQIWSKSTKVLGQEKFGKISKIPIL